MKDWDDLLKPDSRNEHFVKLDPESGETHPWQHKDLYDSLNEISLNVGVPKAVRKLFDRSRNLIVFSWFVYDFTTPALTQVYAAVEMALREKNSQEGIKLQGRPGLKYLMKNAIESGWLLDGGFPHLYRHVADPGWPFAKPQEYDPQGTVYCQVIAKSLPELRNDMAHGSNFLVTPGSALGPLEVSAGIINQLFP